MTKWPLATALRELQEALLERAVDCGRAQADDLQAEFPGPAHGDLFALELALLIDVVWLDRRLLGRRRMLDMTIDADGRAVHEALNLPACRPLDEVADALDIDLEVHFVRDVRRPIERRHVVDDLDAVERALEALPVGQITGHEFEIGMAEPWFAAVGHIVHAPHLVPRLGQVKA
jgi:hypothetical protein